MTTTIDLSRIHPCHCNHGLETLHKAIAEASEPMLWRPHDNPFLAELCEQFTRDGQTRIQSAQDALLGALGLPTGEPVLRKAAGDDQSIDLDAIRARLSKPLSAYTPDDWVTLVDLIMHTRLRPEDVQERAQWFAFRSQLAGRLEAAMAVAFGLTPTQALISLVTAPTHHAPPPVPLTARPAWQWASARIGVDITAVTAASRARISRTIIDHVHEHGVSDRGKLKQALLDDFAVFNRDWRRIAITEASEIANSTYLGEFPSGTRVERLEAYEGACPFCARINGMVFTWSTEPMGEEHGWTHVWPGKTNVGRSASPRKKTEEGLIEREPDELWWPAAGAQHPNCRGRWCALPDEKLPEGVDPEFYKWMTAELDAIQKRANEMGRAAAAKRQQEKP